MCKHVKTLLNLLHDIKFEMFCLKKLNKQLQHQWMEKLMTSTYLKKHRKICILYPITVGIVKTALVSPHPVRPNE